MAKFTGSLDNLHVAAPCKADWEDMFGNDRVRFCGQCQKNVYNLSRMSRREAEALVADREGGLCVRFYRRADGTVITSNCPVGLRLIKRRLSRAARAVISATLSFIAGVGMHVGIAAGDLDPAEVSPVPLVETAPDDEIVEPVAEEFTVINGGI